MGNPTKSKCQLRLEARSLAYQQKRHPHHAPYPSSSHPSRHHHTTITPTPTNANNCNMDNANNTNNCNDCNNCNMGSSNGTSGNMGTMPSHGDSGGGAFLAARQQARIQRAAEVRGVAQRQRMASARARVQHAQRVAAETRARRREALLQSRAAVASRVAVARQRRETALRELQEACRRRVDLVLEKVEAVKEITRLREARARHAMETQLVHAARRREERTQRLVDRLSQRWQSVESVKDRVQRAKWCIQRWCARQSEARRVARHVTRVEPDLTRLVRCWQRMARSGMDESMALLRPRELARAAQAVLRVLLPEPESASSSASVSSPRGRPRSPTTGAPFRVLLMVGMLAAHPREVMESEPCAQLVFVARAVVHDLTALQDRLQTSASPPPSMALEHLVASASARFAVYMDCFSRWKDRDAERLAQEMLGGYHAIFRTKLHYDALSAEAEGDGLHELRRQTELQLAQLQRALAQVLGKEEAVARVTAVKRSLQSQGHEQEAAQEDEEEREMEMEPSPVPSPSPSPSRRERGSETTTVERATSEAPPAQLTPLLSNEALVHELILNPSFRFPSHLSAAATHGDGDEEGSLAARVATTMRRAFWDDVVARNDVGTLLLHLEELRMRVAQAMAGHSQWMTAVNEALHADTLRGLMQDPVTHAHAIKTRCLHVLHVLLQAEAPARNDTTRAFVAQVEAQFQVGQSSNAVKPPLVRILADFLAFSLEKVEEMQLDTMNAHVGMLAAYLQRHGVEYERKRFYANASSLTMTERWLTQELATQWPQLTPEQRHGMQRGDADTFVQCIRNGMMALVVKYIEGATSPHDSERRHAVWPETFALDVERIRGHRDVMDRVAVISSLLVVAQEFLQRHRVRVPTNFVDRVGQDLSALLKSPGVSGAHLVTQVIDEIKRAAVPTGGASQSARQLEVDASEWQTLEQRLRSAFQANNAVFTLLFGRVTRAIQSGVTGDDRQGANTLIQIDPSLAPFAQELRETAAALRALMQHNQKVHAAFYNQLIQRVVPALQ